MLRQVNIYGHLAERFGSKPLMVDIASPVDAVRALIALRPGFGRELRKGEYHILVKNGDRYFDLGEEELNMQLGHSKEVHIVPVMAGSKGATSGVLKIVLGVALVAGALFFAPVLAAGGLGATAFGFAGMGVTYGQIAMIGVSLAVAGAASLLSPKPKSKDDKKDDSSYIISAGENVAEQGASVPIVLGRFLVGSVVMSIGLSTEQIGQDGLKYPGQG